jgi:hypothetical protein
VQLGRVKAPTISIPSNFAENTLMGHSELNVILDGWRPASDADSGGGAVVVVEVSLITLPGRRRRSPSRS